MRETMNVLLIKYLKCFFMGVINNIEYRFNIMTVLIFNFIPIIINFYLWKAIYLSKGIGVNQLGGMTLNQIVTYIIIAQFIDLIIGTSSIEYKVMNEIKNGDICKYLQRPVNYLLYNLMLSLSKSFIYIVPVVTISGVIYVMFKNYIIIQDNLFFILLLIISVIISYLIKFFISFLLGLLGFFLNEISQLYYMIGIIIRFFSGFVFPLSFLPFGLDKISMMFPFQYMGYFPSMIFIGMFDLYEIVRGILIGSLWILILFLFYRYIWKIGLRRYSAFGG